MTASTASSTTSGTCLCGHRLATLKEPSARGNNSNAMEGSFVHLDQVSTPMGALHQIETLLKVTEGQAMQEGIWLCFECLDRAARALETSTERLNEECLAYEREAKDRAARTRRIERNLGSRLFPPTNMNEGGEDVFERIERSFREEIAVLEQAVATQELELEHLETVEQEQDNIAHQLDEVDEKLAHERNSLELDARDMSYTQSQMSMTLQQAQDEVEKLASVNLMTLFSLKIDKRGLRFPLINELRLAFCPKGDLTWGEIQAAWSQVAQLLLSSNLRLDGSWRIIPLTPCAKIIHDKTVYNLGKDMPSMAKALKALVKLLNQSRLILPNLQFLTKVDDLPQLDHPNWSKVIHHLACTLQDLCDVVHQQRLDNVKALLV